VLRFFSFPAANRNRTGRRESESLTIFGRVRRRGRRRDLARRRPVATDLMQEVDGFTDEQNLEGPERVHVTEGKRSCSQGRTLTDFFPHTD